MYLFIPHANVVKGSIGELTYWDSIKQAVSQCFADKRSLECLEQDLLMPYPFTGESIFKITNGYRLVIWRNGFLALL